MTFSWLYLIFKQKYLQLIFSGSRTVTLERAWLSIWNCWLREKSNSDFWSCYQNAFPMQIENECELLPILALVFLSVLHFLDSDPWVSSQCKEPLLRCMCPIAFRRHIMHCRRVSSSAWIMQTWWTINLSLWIWSCWCFSLLGNSLRNIKPSFFEVSPNYFFRQEKKKYYVS